MYIPSSKGFIIDKEFKIMGPEIRILDNAVIYDGTGAPPFRGYVQMEGDRIVKIGRGLYSGKPGCDVLSLDDKAVLPGFIDTHSHSDISLMAAPDGLGKISQGVTTEINGNCGLSPFPVTEFNREHLQNVWKNYGIKIDWNDVDGYARALEQCCPAVNSACLCGHNTLRAAVLGYEDIPVTDRRMSDMQSLLERMLSQGALGFSTGLLYVPGKFSNRDELTALADILRSYDCVYSTHLRNEGDKLEEALREAVFLAGAGSRRLEISHLKTALERNWGKLHNVLDIIKSAQNEGIRVTADRYPYTYGQTNLSIILPPPYDRMPDSEITKKFRSDPAAAESAAKELAATANGTQWEKIILSNVPYDERLCGFTVAEAAEKLSLSPAALVVKLVTCDSNGTMAAFGGLSEENMMQIIQLDYVSCGSDESVRSSDYSLGRSHPRGFGAFPEFYRLCVQAGQTPESVIYRMTGMPAEIFGISQRGILKEGAYADIAVLDLDKFAAKSTFARPHALASGVECVFVNGKLSYRDGVSFGRNGRFLRLQAGAANRRKG